MIPDFGEKRLGMRSNFNLVMFFLWGSLGSYAAGAVKSRTGSYKLVFLLNSVCFFIVSVVGLSCYFSTKRSKQMETESIPLL